MTKRVLHLMHHSTQFSDSAAKFSADLRQDLKREPHILSLGETKTHLAELRQVARELGYTPVININGNNEAFCVRTSDDRIRVKDKGAFKVLDGEAGSHSARFVHYVRVSWYGEDLWFHTAHWSLVRNARDKVKHQKITDQMITQVKKHGQKGAISFFSGDVNDDDQPNGNVKTNWNQKFRQNGLLTIWDEFKVYPATMGYVGRTIDVIGSYDADKRVKGERYKAWPMGHSDHRAISAWYEIDTAKKPKKDDTKPTAGDQSGNQKDDDFYATGGKVSYVDYMDGEIYQLDRAVDDSGE